MKYQDDYLHMKRDEDYRPSSRAEKRESQKRKKRFAKKVIRLGAMWWKSLDDTQKENVMRDWDKVIRDYTYWGGQKPDFKNFINKSKRNYKNLKNLRELQINKLLEY